MAKRLARYARAHVERRRVGDAEETAGQQRVKREVGGTLGRQCGVHVQHARREQRLPIPGEEGVGLVRGSLLGRTDHLQPTRDERQLLVIQAAQRGDGTVGPLRAVVFNRGPVGAKALQCLRGGIPLPAAQRAG